MTSRVVVVELDENGAFPLKKALSLLGGMDSLDSAERSVVIKVGVFSAEAENHSSVSVVQGIINCFTLTPKIFVAESDNYKGTGSERLQIWKSLYSDRVIPFNLSSDSETRLVKVAGQQMALSHVLFKPNVLVDTHILRSFERGSILKNLFGCIPDTKRVKYHSVLPVLLADVYEAIGGVDLAVLDGTYLWKGAGDSPLPMGTLLVGRDAVAVETVGAVLAGLDLKNQKVIQEFVRRGLGEGRIENIEILGSSLEKLLEKSRSAATFQNKQQRRSAGPQTWGGRTNRAFRHLMQDGFFSKKRTLDSVMKALETEGIETKGKEDRVACFLERRMKNGKLKKSQESGKDSYSTE
jgi:uncharacterized protein (DUF362 family)